MDVQIHVKFESPLKTLLQPQWRTYAGKGKRKILLEQLTWFTRNKNGVSLLSLLKITVPTRSFCMQISYALHIYLVLRINPCKKKSPANLHK